MKRTAIAVLVMCLALATAGYQPLHAAVTSEEEIPVCAPLPFADGRTLHATPEGIHFALFPRVGGRAPEDLGPTELEQLGLVKSSRLLEWRHHVLPHAYPVYVLDYAASVERIIDALRPIANLDTLGRAGRFVYGHLHDQLRVAKDYVRASAAG